MSYCRWSECDVYAYDSCEGGVRFLVAGDDCFNRLCGTYNEAYQYAKRLRDEHGFDVPDHAIEELREDAIDEAKQYFGPDSAVADMMAENAKLKQELEAVGTAAYLYGRNDLADENAKLREMVADMWRFTGTACKKYPRLFYPAAQGGQMVQLNMLDSFEQRMRELGIEVEE